MWFIATLIGNLYLGLLVFFQGNENLLVSLILFGTFAWFSCEMAALVHSPRVRPVLFIFLFYWGYGFILPGLYQTRSSSLHWPSRVTFAETGVQAAIVVFVATVTFSVGLRLARRKKKARYRGGSVPHLVVTPGMVRASELGTLAIAAYVGFLLYLFGFEIFVGTRGALFELAFVELNLERSMAAMLRTFPRGAAIGTLAMTSVIVASTRGRRRFVAFGISLSTNLLVNNPVAAARSWVFAVLFILLITIFRVRFERSRRAIYLIMPAAVFFVFPTLGQFSRGLEVRLAFSSLSLSDFLAHGDLDGFQSVMNSVSMVSTEGLAFGQRIMSAALFAVPRSLWEGKMEPTGVEAAMHAGYDYTNVSMPLPGEFYADGGLLIVCVGMMAYGYFVARMDQYYILRGSVTGYMYATTIAAFVPIVVRGSLLATVQGMMVAIGVIYCAGKLAGLGPRTKRRRSLRRRPG